MNAPAAGAGQCERFADTFGDNRDQLRAASSLPPDVAAALVAIRVDTWCVAVATMKHTGADMLLRGHAMSLLGFLLLVVGGGLLIGALTGPGEWYARLAKPAFNPPNWVFGPVWTLLYVFIAIAGWRTWRRREDRPARLIWGLQLVLNFLWSPAFFAAHRIDVAAVIIVLLLVAIVLFIARSWRPDRVAALLFVPYAAWVSFATVLNVSLLRLNGAA